MPSVWFSYYRIGWKTGGGYQFCGNGDASTAGDFCRRFESKEQIDCLHHAIDEARRNVWAQQPEEFFDCATVDIVCKHIDEMKGQKLLLDDVRYLFYITNDRTSTPAEIVFTCNARCEQENLIEQLKNCPRSLTAPVDNLYSNWAYMLMASLGWTLKA